MPEYHSGRTYSNSSGYHEPPITPMTKEQHQKLLDTFSKRVARSKAKDKTTEVEHESLENKSVEHSAPVKKQQSLYSYAPPELEPQNQSVSLVERGEQAYQQKDYATAYDIYSEVVKLEPNNYKAWFHLQTSAVKTDNHIVAIEASQKLIDSGKYTAQAYYFRGVSLEKVGRKQKAAVAYQKAGVEIPEAQSAFFRLEEERLFGGQSKETLNVSQLSQVDKLVEAVSRSAKYFPGEIAEELKAIFSPANLAIMMGVFVVYAAASFTGFSQGLTFAMAMAGILFFGMDIVAIFGDLAGFADAINANTEEELDEAGQHLASLVAKIGVDALMTLLTGKIAQEIGKSVDNLNQVDEVYAHSEGTNRSGGDLDNANNSNATRSSDIDNVNNTTANQNITNTPAQQLINAGYNPVAVNTLLPVLGLDGIERLHKMDMFSFAPERMNLINSGYGQTVRNLPDLKDRPRVEIEGILDNAGFDRPTVGTTGGQEMWLHPDGSVVRMKLGPQALKDTRRSTEHLVREISRKQPASSKNRDIFAKVSEDGTLIPAGPKFAKDQLQQWFKKETGKLPNSDELDELLRVWADAGHINFQP